ncbi:hypothetical protein ES705_33945 [subsurface metagenome]
MIGDITLLKLSKTDKPVMRMHAIIEKEYHEFWSFWGIEKAYQKIEGQKRLRYHLGHVLITQYLREISNHGNTIRPILLDYKGGMGTQVVWSDDDVEITKEFLRCFLGETVQPESYGNYFKEIISTSESEKLYENISSQTHQLTQPIRDAYDRLVQNDNTGYHLYKYRDMSIADFQYVPQSLYDIYESFERRDIIPPHIFFASLFALHISSVSESNFIDGFWVKEGFPFLACIQRGKDHKICIIEGKRSAYIWLFMDYLRIMYEHKNNDKLNFPDIGFIDSLPSINGAPFMQLNNPSEALFIDSRDSEIKQKLMHTSNTTRQEYSLRIFRDVYNEKPLADWVAEAVQKCKGYRAQIYSIRLRESVIITLFRAFFDGAKEFTYIKAILSFVIGIKDRFKR